MPETQSAGGHRRLRRKGLHWADKTGLAIAAILAAMAAGFWIIICAAVGSFVYPRFNAAMLAWTLDGELAVAVPIWAALRCGALIAGYGRRAWRFLRSGWRTPPAAMRPDPGWR